MNPEIMSFQYATGMRLLLENVGGCEQNLSVANVQNVDLWPSCMHAATTKYRVDCILPARMRDRSRNGTALLCATRLIIDK